MKGILWRTRHEIVRRAFGPRRRLTAGQAVRAFRWMAERGWLTAMPADGPAFEMIAFVHHLHPMADIVVNYGSKARRFLRAGIEQLVGSSVTDPRGSANLAKAGFAVVGSNGAWIELRAADPRAARLVNESRRLRKVRGFSVRQVIDFFLNIRDPKQARVNVTDDRRLLTAETLHDCWRIECDDLLAGRSRVRLFSKWTFETD